MEKEAKRKAYERALDELEEIIDTWEGSNFLEVTGKIGGDVLCFRYYEDGTATER